MKIASHYAKIGAGILAMLAMSCSSGFEPAKTFISDGWTLSSGDSTYEATVPSTVMGVLTANGLYADAFEGDNYKNIDKSIFDTPWRYSRSIEVPAVPADGHAVLGFEGLGWGADVWMDGVKIASRDTLYGPYRRFELDITPYAGKTSRLDIDVYRAQPGDPNIGFVDWNPRPADESMGIFRPVYVATTGAVDLRNPAVRSKVNTETLDEAWLTVEATLANKSSRPVNGVLKGSFEGGAFELPVSLEAGETRTVTLNADDNDVLHVKNPRLWWCHNMGEPEMYGMKLEFVADGALSDSENVNFGIRQIDEYFTPEGYRGFLLNGKNVLVRGAGWTDDIFLRNTPESNETEVQYVRDMNLNTIRFENFWGTSEDIYDLCDRYGLLALAGWSCFWEWENYMGCPGDDYGCISSERNMDLTVKSLRDQLLWLRNHPSIIGWFVGSDMLPRPELEKRYLEILPEIDDRPYIGAAKELTSELTGPTGMKMAGPYDYVAPNYWFDAQAPGGAFGFNTETGIGAQLPVEESIRRMIPADSLWPAGRVWDYHCTTAGEDMHSLDVLKDVIAKRYGTPENLKDFLRKADLVNYDGTRAMFEAFRVNVPKATGVIQWMLNSAWPSLYWQLYDYYLQPTAAYYSVKHANEPVQLIYNYGDHAVYAVNEGPAAVEAVATMKLYDVAGRPASDTKSVSVAPYGVTKVFDRPAFDGTGFLFLSLADAAGKNIARNQYCISSTDDVNDWSRSTWIRTPVARHGDFSGLKALAAADCTIKEAVVNGNKLDVTIENASPCVAFFLRLALKDENGNLVTPAIWEDNYTSLEPNETRTISVDFSRAHNMPSRAVLELSGWNVAETTKHISNK